MASENTFGWTTDDGGFLIPRNIIPYSKRHSEQIVKSDDNFEQDDSTSRLTVSNFDIKTPIGYSITKNKSLHTTKAVESHYNFESQKSNRSSSRKAGIEKLSDEQLLKNEDLKILTLTNIERIERDKRERKKEMKIRLQDDEGNLNMDNLNIKNEEREEESKTEDLSSNELDEKQRFFLEKMLSDVDDTSSTTSSSESRNTQICSVSINEQFLEDFTKLPDIKNIPSETNSEAEIRKRNAKIHSKVFDPDLYGKFVDPVTGETDTESSLDDPDNDDNADNFASNSGEEEIEDELSDFELLDEDIVPVIRKEKVNFFDDFAAMEFEEKEFETVTSVEIKVLQVNSVDVVKDFLENLLHEVVTTVQVKDQLSSKLDKTKLLNELIELMTTYNIEKSLNGKLNAKVVEHYRRSNKIWAISKLPINVELLEYGRYQEALIVLDSLREKAVITKKRTMHNLDNVYSEMESVQISCATMIKKFEQRLLRIIANLDSEFLNRTMENNLQLMRELRLEIGESRMELITKRDILARLQERKTDFEQITQDLTMTEYLTVQRDVLKMSKLLEGRTITFDQMHEQCDNYLKRVAFYREKRDITAALLQCEVEKLEELQSTRDNLRTQLMELNLVNARNKALKLKLDIKAGILYKPALMFDFDKCTEFVIEKRKIVLELRRRMEKLVNRLTAFSECIQSV